MTGVVSPRRYLADRPQEKSSDTLMGSAGTLTLKKALIRGDLVTSSADSYIKPVYLISGVVCLVTPANSDRPLQQYSVRPPPSTSSQKRVLQAIHWMVSSKIKAILQRTGIGILSRYTIVYRVSLIGLQLVLDVHYESRVPLPITKPSRILFTSILDPHQTGSCVMKASNANPKRKLSQ